MSLNVVGHSGCKNGQSMSTSYKHFTTATNAHLTGGDLGVLKRGFRYIDGVVGDLLILPHFS